MAIDWSSRRKTGPENVCPVLVVWQKFSFPSKAKGKSGVAGLPTLHGAYLTKQHVQPPCDNVVR